MVVGIFMEDITMDQFVHVMTVVTAAKDLYPEIRQDSEPKIPNAAEGFATDQIPVAIGV